RGDVKGFFQRKRALHLLCDEPDMAFNTDLAGKHGRSKGIHMNDKRKANALIYLRDLMREKVGKNVYSNEDRLFLHYYYDAGGIKELLKWNKKGNFDRVSALLVGMYDLKEQESKNLAPELPNTQDDFF